MARVKSTSLILAKITYQSGADTVVRSNFLNNAHLPNTTDLNFRAVRDNW